MWTPIRLYPLKMRLYPIFCLRAWILFGAGFTLGWFLTSLKKVPISPITNVCLNIRLSGLQGPYYIRLAPLEPHFDS